MTSIYSLVERLAMSASNSNRLRRKLHLPSSQSITEKAPKNSLTIGQTLVSPGHIPGPLYVPMTAFEKSTYLLGSSGCGKTTLLLNLFNAFVGKTGIVMVDLYGDLIDRALLALANRDSSESLSERLFLLDFRYPEMLPPVNLLSEASGVSDPWTRSAMALHALRDTSENWGTTIESCARNTFLLLAASNRSIAESLAVLNSQELQAKLLRQVDDEPCRIWFSMLKELSASRRHDLTAPFLNRISHLTTRPALRSFFGTQGSISFREILDQTEAPIVLIGLAGAVLGPSTARLVGTLLVSSITNVILARASQAQSTRRPVRLLIDEFENFVATDAFATLLAEGRRYQASLVLAHQHARQLPRELFDAIVGNAATTVLFQSAAEQASRMLPNIITKVPKADLLSKLISQPVGQCWLLRRGQESLPLALENYVDPIVSPEYLVQLRERSAAKYATPPVSQVAPEEEEESPEEMEFEDVDAPHPFDQ